MLCLLPVKGVALCFIYVLLSSARKGCYLVLRDNRSHEFNSLIAYIQQLVTLDGRVKLAVSGIREALWRRLVNASFY